ncbi:MAG: hypothetical protein HC892_01410 [Saprospiraceae bacterium]|nr:hypothetical protein [Saprospiraceae bacterium]
MKRILIAAPTSSFKDYVFDDWIENAINIAKDYDYKGSHVGIMLIDNSKDITHAETLLNKANAVLKKLEYNCFLFIKKLLC